MLSRQAIERAAAVLERGEAVILPTDTVPGLFVQDTDKGEDLLRKIKERIGNKPFARMFAGKRQLSKRVTIRNKLQAKAVSTLLPGKVTLILPSGRRKETFIGVRIPEDSSLRALIRRTGPLIATSANLSGQALRDPVSLPQGLLSRVSLVEEDEDIRFSGFKQIHSTVIDITSSRRVVVKRKGAASLWEIAAKLEKNPVLEYPLGLNILFVCGGNTCRSPMAAEIFTALCGNERIEVRSAGLSVSYGSEASVSADRIMVERGLSLSGHRASPLNGNLLYWADLVLVMTRSHFLRIRNRYPQAKDITYLMSGFPASWPYGRNIKDPIGMPVSVYRETADVLERYCRKICSQISKVLIYIHQKDRG
ncbi:hypothetical protein GF359_07775 [candidate division WOR-3 bacterium]|uniref:L-threonylcarbamoyladenylate synthase n=1 Tax=candidate division WOR-3 bacterium TaxID=2052148 RepID=A0A9D5QCZ8_UNCW3|nr:hypothetical protein [candidate division WOR-3 bacterium]MBD3365099.1 hypothetical protein [candidate division WOR-3 bacterium]